MSLEVRTTPIWTYNNTKYMYPYSTGYSALNKMATQLSSEYNHTFTVYANSTYNTSAGYTGVTLTFDGDNPPKGNSAPARNASEGRPACIYFGPTGTSASSSTAKLYIYAYSGGPKANATEYIFDTGMLASTANVEDRQNVAIINHGGKTLLTLVKDSPGSGEHRVFAAMMDHTRRRIVMLINCYPTASTAIDPKIITIQQSGRFDIDNEDESYSFPTYKHSIITLPSPVNSENVISLAPFVAPEEASIVEDVFSPMYLRNSQDMQQFDIFNGSATSRYIASGTSSANGAQFVTRMEATTD